MIFRSKISYSLLIFFIISFGVTLAIILSETEPKYWWLFLPMLPSIIMIIDLYRNTYYTITDGMLMVKSGVLFQAKFPIAKIIRIRKSHTLLSSPALSFDRLEIFYSPRRSVAVSPKDPESFIAALLDINPEIEVDVKK